MVRISFVLALAAAFALPITAEAGNIGGGGGGGAKCGGTQPVQKITPALRKSGGNGCASCLPDSGGKVVAPSDVKAPEKPKPAPAPTTIGSQSSGSGAGKVEFFDPAAKQGGGSGPSTGTGASTTDSKKQ